MNQQTPATDRKAAGSASEAGSTAFARRPSFLGTQTWRVALLTAFVGTLAFYLPLISALQPGNVHWPDFMLSHDERVFYFPSFVEGYRRFWNGGIAGLDFLSGDGASVFSARPNLLPYYPPYLFSYIFFDCANLKIGMLVYVGINIIHEAIGLFFTVLFVRRYLGLTSGAAVLAATIYGLTYQASLYSVFATFYFQMMLMPLVACTLCWLMRTRSRLAPFLASPVFVVYALTNYGPTMMAGLGLAVAAALTSIYVWGDEAHPRRWTSLLRPAASLALAGLACAPYFAEQLTFKSFIAPTADDIDQVAHNLAFSGFDLLNGLSQFADIHRADNTEGKIVWGSIPIFLCFYGLDVILSKPSITPRLIRIAGITAIIYLASLSITLGTSFLTVADAFYYVVPIIGKMHIFQRYLMFSQLFFAIMVSAMASVVILHATPATKRSGAYAGVAIWIGVTAICLIWPPASPTFEVGNLLVEMFLLAAAGIAIGLASPTSAFLLLSVFCATIGLHSDYELPIAFNKPAELADEPDPLGSEAASILNFVEANNGGKALSKIVVASPSVATYFNRNLTWLIGSKVKITSFIGYPPHLSLLADYVPNWFPYGKIDVPWLEATGADFVFWNDATAGPWNLLKSEDFTVGPTLDLAFGNHVGKLHLPSESARESLLDLAQDSTKAWPAAMLLDGWAVRDRGLVKTPGLENHFGYHVDEHAGHTYDVSLDVDAGSSGLLTVAFGNAVIDTRMVSGAVHIQKRVITSAIGDLWITAGADFKGSLSNILVRAVVVSGPPVSYDNGLVRISGGDDPVKAFSTNYTNHVALQTDADQPLTLTNLLWPNPYMVPYLDGVRKTWNNPSARPVSITLNPGHHEFEMRFESRAGTLFVWTMRFYLFVLGGSIVFAFLPPPLELYRRGKRMVVARAGRSASAG